MQSATPLPDTYETHSGQAIPSGCLVPATIFNAIGESSLCRLGLSVLPRISLCLSELLPGQLSDLKQETDGCLSLGYLVYIHQDPPSCQNLQQHFFLQHTSATKMSPQALFQLLNTSMTRHTCFAKLSRRRLLFADLPKSLRCT